MTNASVKIPVRITGPSYRAYRSSDFEKLWLLYKSDKLEIEKGFGKLLFLHWVTRFEASFDQLYIGCYNDSIIALIGCYVRDSTIEPHVDYATGVSPRQVYELTRYFLNSIADQFNTLELIVATKVKKLFDRLQVQCCLTYTGELDNGHAYRRARNDVVARTHATDRATGSRS